MNIIQYHSTQKFVKWASGEKFYRAAVADNQFGLRNLKRRFRTATMAEIYGRRAAARFNAASAACQAGDAEPMLSGGGDDQVFGVPNLVGEEA